MSDLIVVVFDYIGILFGIFIYCLIAFALIEYWVNASFTETEKEQKIRYKGFHKFCKICCLFWQIGVPLLTVLAVIYLAFAD